MNTGTKLQSSLLAFLLVAYFSLGHSGENRWTDNMLINAGAEAGTLDGWTTDDPVIVQASQSQNSTSGAVTPYSGRWFFNMGSRPAAPSGDSASRILFQDVDVSQYATAIDDSRVVARASVYLQTEDREELEGADFAWLTLNFFDDNGTTIDRWRGRFQSPNLIWFQARLKGAVPPRARIVRFELKGEKLETTDINAFFDNARLQVTRPEKIVSIDVKPGSRKNPIKPHAKGKLWVAMLGGVDFDVTQIDPATLQLGTHMASSDKFRYKDVDHDGYLDLLGRFQVSKTGISCGDTEIDLTANMFEGQALTGTDSIKTVDCR